MVLKSVSVKSDRMGKIGKKIPHINHRDSPTQRCNVRFRPPWALSLYFVLFAVSSFFFLARSRCTVSPLAIRDFPRRILHYNHNFRKWFCSWRRSWKHVGTHRATSTGCFSFLWSVKSITSITARILLSKIIIITELLSIPLLESSKTKRHVKPIF